MIGSQAANSQAANPRSARRFGGGSRLAPTGFADLGQREGDQVMIGPSLLLAIVLGAAVFWSLLSSVAQLLASETMGRTTLRMAHGASAFLVLVVMACLSSAADQSTLLGVDPIPIAVGAGALLAVAALTAALLEVGCWKRLMPTPMMIFGALVAGGVPFVV